MVLTISCAAHLRPLQASWNSLRASTQFMPIFSSRCFRVKSPQSWLVPTLFFKKTEEYSFRRMRFCVRAGNELNKKLKGEGGGVEEEDERLQDVLVDKQQIQALDNMGSSTSGELHLIVGPMFAGKTTALIHRMQTEIQMGRNVVLVKSNKDTRYGLSSVVSHDGAKMPCWAAGDLASFKAKLGEEAYRKLDVIGIDEAQFFIDLYSFCQVAADRDAKTLIVAGLDGDYLRKSFGSALDLIPLADSVTKLQSRCEMCGQACIIHVTKNWREKTEVIGGADVYMPVCRQHYVNGTDCC